MRRIADFQMGPFFAFLAFGALFVWGQAFGLPSIENVKKINLAGLETANYKFMYFSGQPNQKVVEGLPSAGIEAVINLRRFDENPFEVDALTTSLGMDYRQVPLLDANGDIIKENLETLELLHQEFHDRDHLIYCASGNRAAMWFALHLIIKHDAPAEDAITFANALGLTSEGLREKIRAFAEE